MQKEPGDQHALCVLTDTTISHFPGFLWDLNESRREKNKASCCYLAMGIMTYMPKLREGCGCHLGHYSRNMSPHRILPFIRDSGADLNTR